MKTIAVLGSATRALALAMVAAIASHGNAQPWHVQFDVSQKHQFAVTPGGNVLPEVTGYYFVHAWVVEQSRTEAKYLPPGQQAGFDEYGFEIVGANDVIFNVPRVGPPVQAFQGSFLIPAAGVGTPAVPDCVLAQILPGPSQATGYSCFYVEPFAVGSNVSGTIEAGGAGIASTPSQGAAWAYAFGYAAVRVRAGNQLASGQVVWTPVLTDSVSAGGGAMAVHDPVTITVEDLNGGGVFSEELFSLELAPADPADPRPIEGDISWDAGVFSTTVRNLRFSLIIGGTTLTSPPGHAEFEIVNGVVTGASSSGALMGSVPPLGAGVPLAFPFNNQFTLTYDASGMLPNIDRATLDLSGAAGMPVVAKCGADINADGFVTGEDFDTFVEWFVEGLVNADYNNDGFVTGDDFDAFVEAFVAGC